MAETANGSLYGRAERGQHGTSEQQWPKGRPTVAANKDTKRLQNSLMTKGMLQKVVQSG